MTREQLIDVLHERSPLFIDRDAFGLSLTGWEISPVQIDGKLAFVTLRNGPEFHFQPLDSGAQISRRMIRDFLKPIIADHGFAVTRTPKTDARQDRFNRKIGFTAVAENEVDRIYRIERIPYAEKATCR